MINAIIIDEKDSVAVAIEPITKGSEVSYKLKGLVKTVLTLEEIQIYHKIAIKEVKIGEPVVKYGQHIGIAAKDIKVGEHVHVHNVESHRENLEEELI
ncbi:MAG TPA: UxaA family hydrolase [Clostridium sp.]|uniref:UxaA family hydrolase n=1 Tax=Clostridium sp. TaxID=1506 RepID=UPI002F94E234